MNFIETNDNRNIETEKSPKYGEKSPVTEKLKNCNKVVDKCNKHRYNKPIPDEAAAASPTAVSRGIGPPGRLGHPHGSFSQVSNL